MESRGTVQLDWIDHGNASETGDRRDKGAAQSAFAAFVKSVASAAAAMADASGPFTFFALMQRRGGVGTWDLVVAAPWLDAEKVESFEYVNRKLGEVLHRKEARQLSRTVVLPASDIRIRAFIDGLYATGHPVSTNAAGPIRLRNFEFSGVQIRRAYIIFAGDPPLVEQRYRKKRQHNPPGVVESMPHHPQISLPPDDQGRTGT
jgi:hypothetical protein